MGRCGTSARHQPASPRGRAPLAPPGGEAVPQPVGGELQPCHTRGCCWLTAEPVCGQLEGTCNPVVKVLELLLLLLLPQFCVHVCVFAHAHSSQPTSGQQCERRKVCQFSWSFCEWTTTEWCARWPRRYATWRWMGATRNSLVCVFCDTLVTVAVIRIVRIVVGCLVCFNEEKTSTKHACCSVCKCVGVSRGKNKMKKKK